MLPRVIMAYLKAYGGIIFGLLSLKKTPGNQHENIIQRLEKSTEMNKASHFCFPWCIMIHFTRMNCFYWWI